MRTIDFNAVTIGFDVMPDLWLSIVKSRDQGIDINISDGKYDP